MRYARISRFEFNPERSDELIRKGNTGLIPLFRTLPGFIDYEGVTTGEGKGVSLALWDTKEHADKAQERAAEWIKSNVAALLTKTEVMIGSVTIASGLAASEAETLVRSVYEAFNARRLDDLASLAKAGAMMETVPFGVTLGLKEYLQNWATAFPDGRYEVIRIYGAGSMVCAETIGRGTQTGPLVGPGGTVPPTGRKVELRLCECFELEDGKIARAHAYFDGASFFRQLGITLEQIVKKPGEAPREVPARH